SPRSRAANRSRPSRARRCAGRAARARAGERPRARAARAAGSCGRVRARARSDGDPEIRGYGDPGMELSLGRPADAVGRRVALALAEDVGPGDLTAEAVVPADVPG